MSILLTSETCVIVQGLTSEFAGSQARAMMRYGTRIVAGVTPGRGGDSAQGVPVFDTVCEAMQAHPADATAIYVGAQRLLDAAVDAVDAGIKLMFVSAEGLPIKDVLYLRALARRHEVWMVGPNSLGLITPGQAVIGSYAPDLVKPGRIGLMSRGGTLILYVSSVLTAAGVGVSTAVHVGGESVLGRNPAEYLQAFEADHATDAVVMLSEVGGGKDHEAAAFIRTMRKPVVAMIVGSTVPPGKAMGHAGAIVGAEEHAVASKRDALRSAGAIVVDIPAEIPLALRSVL